jgi:hypothetical protein
MMILTLTTQIICSKMTLSFRPISHLERKRGWMSDMRGIFESRDDLTVASSLGG